MRVFRCDISSVLVVGNQTRPKLFDLNIAQPTVLYDEVVEVPERVFLDDARCQLEKDQFVRRSATTNEDVFVAKEVDEAALRRLLVPVREKGIKSLAVVLMHSYMFPDHEKVVGKIAREMGFTHVSLSSDIMPMIRIVPRGYTATVDAYLTPCIKKYVEGFASGFKGNLEGVNVTFMQSDGGLTPMDCFNGSRAIISGPATPSGKPG